MAVAIWRHQSVEERFFYRQIQILYGDIFSPTFAKSERRRKVTEYCKTNISIQHVMNYEDTMKIPDWKAICYSVPDDYEVIFGGRLLQYCSRLSPLMYTQQEAAILFLEWWDRMKDAWFWRLCRVITWVSWCPLFESPLWRKSCKV